MRKSMTLLAILALTLSFGMRPALATVIGGVTTDHQESEGVIEPTPVQPLVVTGDSAVAATTIDFDTGTGPCSFSSTVALTNQYAAQGVTFSGPGGNNGGALLNECSNFYVTGYSPPNFLAFNTSASLSNGGIPKGPETMIFSPSAGNVSINAGSKNAGTVTMECFQNGGAPVGSDQITGTDALQNLSVLGDNIGFCEISFTGSWLVLDDLVFEASSEPKNWSTAYRQIFDRKSDLALMRQYRDQVLGNSVEGRLFTGRLYEKSSRALAVLLRNPNLMAQAKSLINANRNAMALVLKGRQGRIHDTGAIVAFLNAFAEKSPAALKTFVEGVKADMLNKYQKGQPFLGFRLK